MKVLQINCVYNNGSTGKIVYDIHTELKNKGIESIVCYGRGLKVNEPNIYKTCGELYSKFNNLLSRFSGVMYGGCFFSTYRLINIIKKEKPDVVHLHCLNGYFVNIYKLITWLKNSKIKTVLTLHAEFMYTANCGHAFDCDKWITGCGNCQSLKKETKSLFFDRTHHSWLMMKKAFDGFNDLLITSVSPWLMNRAKQSPFLLDKNHVVVLNGINTNIFQPREFNDLKMKLGITNGIVLLHVTASFDPTTDNIKGGKFIVELAKQLINKNIKIIVAANSGNPINLPKNIIYYGRTKTQEELAQLYSISDATIITSKKETFSMVCAESLSCGTPIVGFKAGAPEMISLPEYSKFVEYGDLTALKNAIFQTLNKKCNEIVPIAHEKYDKIFMASKYLSLYEFLLKDC